MKAAWLLPLLLALVSRVALAQTGNVTYKVGTTLVSQNNDELVFSTSPPLRVEILPGGRPWPPIFLDDELRLHAGDSVFNLKTGRREYEAAQVKSGDVVVQYPEGLAITVGKIGFIFSRHDRSCRFTAKQLGLGGSKSPIEFFKNANLKVAPSDQKILLLVGPPSSDETKYHIRSVELASCTSPVLARLGSPDYLVELNWSKEGGWWLTGSIEQTLLRSKDGKSWKPFSLPPKLSALVSSYAVNDNEIWLAAGLNSGTPLNPYMLVYTVDAGKTWSSPRLNDVSLRKLPAAWLTGYQRAASPWIDDE